MFDAKRHTIYYADVENSTETKDDESFSAAYLNLIEKPVGSTVAR